jgi:hypothetical protein
MTKSATAAEALGEIRLPVEFAGVTYEVPPTSEWSYDALEAYEDGKIAGFIREILGAEQHAKFKATKPKVSDLSGFIEAIQKALGIAGN